MKVREAIRIIEHAGWVLIRIRGSHRQYKHPRRKGLVTIPGNRNVDLAIGTMHSIFK